MAPRDTSGDAPTRLSSPHPDPAFPGPTPPPSIPSPAARKERTDWAFIGLMVFTGLLFFRPQDQIPALESLHLAELSALRAAGDGRRASQPRTADEPRQPRTVGRVGNGRADSRYRAVLDLAGRLGLDLHRDLLEDHPDLRSDGELADVAEARRPVPVADRDRLRLHRGARRARLRPRHQPRRERPGTRLGRRHLQEPQRPGAQHGRDHAASDVAGAACCRRRAPRRRRALRGAGGRRHRRVPVAQRHHRPRGDDDDFWGPSLPPQTGADDGGRAGDVPGAAAGALLLLASAVEHHRREPGRHRLGARRGRRCCANRLPPSCRIP